MADNIQIKQQDTDIDLVQMPRKDLFRAWYGASSAFAYVYIGAILAKAYGTWVSLVGLILSVIVFGLMTSLVSKYAIENRATVSVFSRTIFGKFGAIISAIVFAVVAIYYAVFESIIVAYAFMEQFGGNMAIWSLLVVLYSTPLIYGGARRVLDKVNGILMPIYIGGLILAVVWASLKYGYSNDWMHYKVNTSQSVSKGGPGWLASFSAWTGVIVLVMFGMDFASLGRKSDIKFHTKWSFGIPFYALAFIFSGTVGILLSFLIPGVETSETGLAGGLVRLMGLLGVLIIIATQTRINTANYYLGASNLAEISKIIGLRIPYIVMVVVTAIIIYLLMLLPVVSYLVQTLAWLGAFVISWVSIAITHLLLIGAQKGEDSSIPDDSYHLFNINGVISWIASFGIGLIMMNMAKFNPDFGGFGQTYGPLAALVVGVIVYFILWHVNPKSRTALK